MNQPNNRPPRPQQRPSRPREVTQYPNISYRRRKAPSFTGALIYAVLFLLVILVSMLFVVRSRERAEAEETRYVPIETTAPAAPDTPDSSPDSDFSSDSVTTAEPPQTTAPPVNEDPAFIGPPTTIRKPKYEEITVSNSDVHAGNLILVNYDYAFVFPESQPQTLLYGNRAKDEDGKSVYALSRADISLNTDVFPIFDGMLLDFYRASGSRDVLITSGYRTFDFQKQLLADRIASQGEEIARQYVAEPGHSEHHAGLAIDMVIFAGGQQYYFPEYDLAAWLVENLPAYGFILRYTEAFQEVTKCAPEPWHYRFVGTPHAQLVTTMGIPFEEYHAYLRQFTWNETRLLIHPDGSVSETDGLDLPAEGYMVYYVPAGEGESTAVPVPPEYEYEISGTNTDGFFVTVTLG